MGKIDSHTVQENRFTRLIPLMGEDGLKRLTQARVMVLGLGGVGSSCCEALARVIRKECRKRHITKLEVLWSPEAAHASHTTNEQGQAILATSSYLPPIMGLMLAGRVLCELSGLGWELDQ